MIGPVPVPKEGEDVELLWRSVARVAEAVNAILNLKVKRSTRDFWTVEKFNAVLELVPGGGSAAVAETRKPWQPYPSSYTGTGTAPDNQALKIRIQPSFVSDKTGFYLFPARRNIEITIPPNCTTGYHVWLVAMFDADGNLTSLDYDHGPGTPPRPSAGGGSGAGAMPTMTYRELFYVTSNATAVDDFSHVQATTPLTVIPVITDIQGNATFRSLLWSPPGSQNYVSIGGSGS